MSGPTWWPQGRLLAITFPGNSFKTLARQNAVLTSTSPLHPFRFLKREDYYNCERAAQCGLDYSDKNPEAVLTANRQDCVDCNRGIPAKRLLTDYIVRIHTYLSMESSLEPRGSVYTGASEINGRSLQICSLDGCRHF